MTAVQPHASAPARCLRARLILISLATAPILVVSTPVAAQLLRQETQGTKVVCTYVGTRQLPDGQVVPRTLTVDLGRPCPESAPYRDPNAPVPGNAALRSETTSAADRICVYEQGAVDYPVSIPLSQRCAPTPDLLRRARVGSGAAAGDDQ